LGKGYRYLAKLIALEVPPLACLNEASPEKRVLAILAFRHVQLSSTQRFSAANALL
jgi:hypothetical protein